MNEDALENILSNLQMAQMWVTLHKDTLIAETDGEGDVHQLDAALVFIETAMSEAQELLES